MSDQPVCVHKFTSDQEINPYFSKMVGVKKICKLFVICDYILEDINKNIIQYNNFNLKRAKYKEKKKKIILHKKDQTKYLKVLSTLQYYLKSAEPRNLAR